MSEASLLSGKDLVKHFPVKRSILSRTQKFVRAVDGVDIEIHAARNLAIVGESGCGKTTLGRILCGIIEPTRGIVEYMGSPVEKTNREEFARGVQPVFQDPYAALNPRKTIRQIIAKPYKIHGISFGEETLSQLLEQVGLSPARSFLDRYPHELSGGQRQRVVMARALALRPKLIVADEPVSGLDATVQAQILSLMRGLQDTHKTTYTIITHDITLVKSMSQRIVVMYLGKMVESGPTGEVTRSPYHPYTASLLRSFPSGDPDRRDWVDSPPIAGEVPSPIDPPSGCRFRTRCPLALEDCALNEPTLEPCGIDRYVACPVVFREHKGGLSSRANS